MSTFKLSTGLENGIPLIRLISFYPLAGHGIWTHCYVKERGHLKKIRALLARKKLGVGAVGRGIWCVQPTVSDKITQESDVH